MKRSVPVLLGLLLACGGGKKGGPPPFDMNTPSNEAQIAQRATEPRGGDPTAAPPVSKSPVTGAQISTSTPSAAGTSAAPANEDLVPPKRIGARHVLVMYMGSERAPTSVVRSKEQAQTLVQEVLKRAKKGEDFARLAVDYSDEPGAAARGGSLGRFGHGQMVPAFEEAAFKLKVNEVSEIVETPFGYHVILRTK